MEDHNNEKRPRQQGRSNYTRRAPRANNNNQNRKPGAPVPAASAPQAAAEKPQPQHRKPQRRRAPQPQQAPSSNEVNAADPSQLQLHRIPQRRSYKQHYYDASTPAVPMHICPLGGLGEVGKNITLYECQGDMILVDCGLQQGGDVYNENELFFDATAIDAVCVTHAHTDHSGRLPLMVKNGYKGPIYATRATCDLLKIMLLDSARIQESDAQWKAKKNKRSGDPTEDALYTVQDATDTLELLVPVSYGDHVELFPGIAADWYDAGHLLGSAAIRFTVTEGAETRTVIFSGDIGNVDKPIIRDPQPVPPADYVVMESTYGDRLHETGEDVPKDLSEIIDRTLARGGNVVIPSFAVGRTQELLYHIREIKARGLVKSNPNFTVYVDSPLALEATQIYDGDLTGYADEETIELLKNGFKPISFPGLKLSRTSQESMALNTDPTPKVIIASSGMCEAGRIRHHLKHNLWRPECSIVFVGYQSEGTMGRQLLDGLTSIKLFGEKIAVRAEICSFKFMSSHADKNGLIHWLEMQGQKSKKVFIVHGEETAALSFCETLQGLGYTAEVPLFESEYSLMDGACLAKGRDFPRDKEKKAGFVSEVFRRLLAAVERLSGIANGYRQSANKDIARFADEVEELCRRWEK